MELSMCNACFRIVRSWGTKSRLNIVEYLWILSMLGLLALLEDKRLGLYLIPPFGATLTILLDLPEAPVAQPYSLVAGSVVGASVGTLAQPVFAWIRDDHSCRGRSVRHH